MVESISADAHSELTGSVSKWAHSRLLVQVKPGIHIQGRYRSTKLAVHSRTLSNLFRVSVCSLRSRSQEVTGGSLEFPDSHVR